MESNGERIAEIQVHPRGQNIRIKRIWKATTPGAEPREEVDEARFMAPNGDMWFLIHLNIVYDHNGRDRTILGVEEHWKILGPWGTPWEKPGHPPAYRTHQIKHIIPLSGESEGKGGLRQECYSEAAEAWARVQAQAKLEGWYGSENFKRARKE